MPREYAREFSGIQFGRRRAAEPTDETASSTEAFASSANGVATIVYIHGIGNKPRASTLKKQWDEALFNVDLGQRSRMAYWVNRDYYPIPLPDDVPEGIQAPLPEPDALTLQLNREAVGAAEEGIDQAIFLEATSLAADKEHQATLLAIARKIQRKQFDSGAQTRFESIAAAEDVQAELLPTEFLRKIVTRNLTRAFLRDVNDFLYDDNRRQVMERSLRDRLDAGGGPFVVIGHSQGSLIAYKVLSELAAEKFDVRLFVTIGSPLGIREVQDELLKMTKGPLAVPRCVARWVNVADRLDPVAVDAKLANDFESRGGVRIEDTARLMLNPDSPRHPHSGTGYLQTEAVRGPVQQTVGPSFSSPIASFVIARDVADAIEDQSSTQRLHVLIELQQVEGVEGLVKRRDLVLHTLEQLPNYDEESARPEALQRFVAVELTRSQIEALATKLTTLDLGRIWRNSEKVSLVVDSCNTINVRPAWESFRTFGSRICWAVLDTGVADMHPHFHPGSKPTIQAQFDCTTWQRNGAVDKMPRRFADSNGHGTHVAGIIAGKLQAMKGNQPIEVSGMAPEATIISYKVLDDRGRGRDSWIIKALQHIAKTNDDSADLVIQGINLSLGGSFDPMVYGCGHSPLCNELRRLWRQGVLICIAAGNRGITEIQTRAGFLQTNLDLTIGDPANLEEAIAVGSVNKHNPHSYGISYFSSRGPTADGRIKPDVIAPGEKILSASSRYRSADSRELSDLYIELSGTSMAAPHISGLLACFLSLRREFIGYPDQVKRILLDSCTTLGRDAYSEGRGVPSLMKMLSGGC